MTVVIDVGAARYGGDYSMERLIDQYDPSHLYAFDPNPALELPELCEETQIELYHAAAWTHLGVIGYRADGLNSWLTFDPEAPQVPCVDLAKFIREIAERHEDDAIILKLDAEGAEYELLAHIISWEADQWLDKVIVEWHPKTERDATERARIERDIRCKIEEWPY